MKILLCKIGKKLGFEVDIEEVQETDLGKLAIRHHVLWYTKQPDWITKLCNIIISRNDLNPKYRKLIKRKAKMTSLIYAAFEIVGSDKTTRAMKGTISNLSKLPYGVVVVKRGRKEAFVEGLEPIRDRYEKALIEFRALHGPNNFIVASFDDIKKLAEELGIK